MPIGARAAFHDRRAAHLFNSSDAEQRLFAGAHFTAGVLRVSDLVGSNDPTFDPQVPVAAYRDGFGNTCTRIVAPKGRTRIGRVLIARGRDASDVAISSTFGRNTLTSFRVWTDEVRAA
jgi:hypothetical protein